MEFFPVTGSVLQCTCYTPNLCQVLGRQTTDSGLRLRAGFMDEWTLRPGLKHEAGSARGWVRKMQREPSRQMTQPTWAKAGGHTKSEYVPSCMERGNRQGALSCLNEWPMDIQEEQNPSS